MHYDGLITKIKAMRGRMLTMGDFETLTGMKSVNEIGKKLQGFPGYQDALSQLTDADMHRNVLERKLVLALSEDFSRIYSFITSFSIRAFLDGFFMNMEISVIKLLLCMVYDERDIVYTLPELSRLISKKFRVNIQGLMDAKTVPEFIEALKGTPYYGVLSGHYEEGSSLFEMETQLDLYYYMHLWELTDENLDKRNRRIMKDIIGTEIDLYNIVCVYRLKSAYSVENEKIYSYLIPIQHKLDQKQLAAMVESRDAQELTAAIDATAYRQAFARFSSTNNVFHGYMLKTYADAAKKYPRSLAGTMGYIFGKQVEISNLTTAMECVRYGLGQDEIMRRLHLRGVRGGDYA
ncbi:MAG: V-type ATPase subunit [Defluviitaleaceae bacterium]|nr:V-type ATPase subunit [Defluviitaleaceae bacterium]